MIPLQVKQISTGYRIESFVNEAIMIAKVVELFDGDRGNQVWITNHVDRRCKFVETEVFCVGKEVAHSLYELCEGYTSKNKRRHVTQQWNWSHMRDLQSFEVR